MTTDFTWIRHGQTHENLTGIVQGHLNTPLDDLGQKQAHCAAERLRAERFDHIFSSDLQRAIETATIIGDTLKQSVTPLSALREWHLGALEGCHRDDIAKNFPQVMTSFKKATGDFSVPGGESHDEFFQRVSDCLETLAREYEGQRLLLVTHGGTLRAIFRHIVGKVSPSCMLPVTSNAGYGRFFKHDELWQLCCWNDTSHLKTVGVRTSLTF